MQTSSYLERALFYEQASPNHDFFEGRAGQIFEQSKERSYVDFHVQRPRHKLSNQSEVSSNHVCNSVQQRDSDPECNSDSEPPTPIDPDLKFDGPPRYTATPVERCRISSGQQLEIHARASKRCFRMCVLHQRHSFSRLLMTADLFNTLMSELGIFPRFKDFILLFGSKRGDNEYGAPRLRFRQHLTRIPESPGGDQSGFECAYGLKYVELNNRSKRKPWSIRQTAIYHQYTCTQGENLSTWLLVAPSKGTKHAVRRYVEGSPDLASLNPFEIHLVMLNTLLANWRPYIMYLTEQINEKSDKLAVVSIDEELLNVDERQALKDFEDLLIDNNLILDSTLDTITSLLTSYQNYFSACQKDSAEASVHESDFICRALREQGGEVSSNRRKMETLHQKVQGSIKLLSSLLDLGNGNSLKQLAEQAREENTTMRKLTEKSTRDAAAVKVLTMITLIYLPATVVSNFFSTEFVRQEQRAGGLSKVILSSNAWLFAAVSVPLTLITLAVWWLWVRAQAFYGDDKGRLRSIWRTQMRYRRKQEEIPLS